MIKNKIIYSIIMLFVGLQIQAQVVLSDENYVHTIVPQVALTIAEINNVDCSNIGAVDNTIESVTYFDGLGRPIQQRAIKASPEGKDIVTHMQYDVYGRQDKQYLPFASNTNSGSLQSVNVDQDINTYYLDTYAQDFPGITNPADVNAYSESVFEDSPLNRVLEQGAPGKAWKADGASDNDHTIKFGWTTNDANEVLYFKVVFTAGNTEKPELVKESYYLPNELHVTVTKDENWRPADGNNHTTREYKNKSGQVVLKRTYASTSSAGVEVAHDTYYVYDDFGNLAFVLPPKVITDNGVSQSELDELCYQYHYDHRNRLIEKKIPGKDWEYIIYNRLDQPVLTQDASLRAKRRWLFTKYDAFGRVAYTGLIENGSTVALLRSKLNSKTYETHESRATTPNTIAGTTLYYTIDDSYPVRMFKIFTVNYYDNYNFDIAGLVNPGTVSGEAITNRTRSLPTGSKVRVLDTNDWITTVTYYDQKSRPVYTASKNEYLNTTDIIESKLDFVGKVLETKTTHTKGTNVAIVTVDTFTYDHMGRVVTQTQKINNQEEERIASNTYDALGQLVKKNVGGSVTATSALQEVDYDYNIRGWLKGINDVATLGNDLFAFGINYGTTTENLGATALYNGNISETLWKTANDNTKRACGYEYDALNRIVAGRSTSGNYNLSTVSYDKAGNILTLNRKGHLNVDANSFGDMDILSYTYDAGNKLLSVEDTANKIYGFKDGNNTNDDFEYDANGNMIQDQNKGITGITYNHLNLPKTVTISNSEGAGTISYLYDATGAKLKKIVTEGSSLINTEYAGNYVYKNGDLQFFATSEGYAEYNNSNGFDYIYQYTDHLGNIRLSYKDANGNGTIAQDEIVQEKNYYPFGLEHKGYNNVVNGTENNHQTFNGKELNKELGLEWLDFEARNYDASIGRWMNIDPHAENYFSLSPYVSFANNPISFVDPDGRDLLFWQLNDNNKWEQVGFDKLSKESQESLLAFAKTDEGFDFLSNFANEGDKIGDVEFDQKGKYAKHELSFGEFNYYGAGGGSSKARHKNGDDKLTFEWTLNQAYRGDKKENGIDVTTSAAITNGHEAFIHFSQYLDELVEAFDNGDMDRVYQIFEERRAVARDGGGRPEHNGYLDGNADFKQMRTYLRQLRQVLNPSKVNKALKSHNENLERYRN
ncbi:DUF6443 domain-containing protein [Aquimarina sp. AU474]|uniref:DUF6443 domain-containing protein n=1 Tax=Aquimarina sp. AU474 TaxID=2108529 RepID=UPI000D68E5F9|nr:DUF6443 domain-containing protein [Aquimarina sp. AU474]